jgi:hypothetical protein
MVPPPIQVPLARQEFTAAAVMFFGKNVLVGLNCKDAGEIKLFPDISIKGIIKLRILVRFI